MNKSPLFPPDRIGHEPGFVLNMVEPGTTPDTASCENVSRIIYVRCPNCSARWAVNLAGRSLDTRTT